MTKAGYFSRRSARANSCAPWTNWLVLSSPRSPEPCRNRTSGYFCPGSIADGESIRYLRTPSLSELILPECVLSERVLSERVLSERVLSECVLPERNSCDEYRACSAALPLSSADVCGLIIIPIALISAMAVKRDTRKPLCAREELERIASRSSWRTCVAASFTLQQS